MSKPINVLIVDDHPIILTAYTSTLDQLSLKESSFTFQVKTALSITDAVTFVDKSPLSNPIDLVLLDISLPKCLLTGITSGEELGGYIRSKFQEVKIIAITSLNDNYRLMDIIKKLDPEGLMVKSDLDNKSLTFAVDRVLNGHKQYSASINALLSKRTQSNFVLDDIDMLILKELGNGAKLSELIALLPLTKSGIEKRKRLLKAKFNLENTSDRNLVITAREKGFL